MAINARIFDHGRMKKRKRKHFVALLSQREVKEGLDIFALVHAFVAKIDDVGIP